MICTIKTTTTSLLQTKASIIGAYLIQTGLPCNASSDSIDHYNMIRQAGRDTECC